MALPLQRLVIRCSRVGSYLQPGRTLRQTRPCAQAVSTRRSPTISAPPCRRPPSIPFHEAPLLRRDPAVASQTSQPPSGLFPLFALKSFQSTVLSPRLLPGIVRVAQPVQPALSQILTPTSSFPPPLPLEILLRGSESSVILCPSASALVLHSILLPESRSTAHLPVPRLRNFSPPRRQVLR